MAILTVGPTSSFPTIAAAMLAAGAGDTIVLEAGYSNETATVTHTGMTVSGDASSTGIVLQLALGVPTFTLAGTAPINVFDAADANSIFGNAGNNVITVSDGADAVDGGLGFDELVVNYQLATGAITGNSTTNVAEAGGSRLVTIANGTFEEFTILTGSGAETITTGASDDFIQTGEGASTVTAGQGANTIIAGSGTDTITALDGGNIIDGGDGPNTITTGAGNDLVTGGVGVDIVVAGGGNDVITVRGGADTSNSGAGDDRLIVDYATFNTAVTGTMSGVLLSGYNGQIADLAGNSVDFQATENFTISTGNGNDVISTGDGIDLLTSGAGNDVLDSGGGGDILAGGLGQDTLTGGAGNDTFNYVIGDGADTVDGGADIDSLAIVGTAGNDTMGVTLNAGVLSGLFGGSVANVEQVTLALGAGTGDTLDYSTTAEAVTVNLATGSGTGFASLTGVENLVGGSGADILNGDIVANRLTGGAGNDTLDGKAGTDTAIFTGARSDYTITALSPTTFQLIDKRALSPEGADVLINIESIQFSDQTVSAVDLVDNPSGLTVQGGAGNDNLFGGTGNDIIIGDLGADTMSGGAGDDIYSVENPGDVVIETANNGTDTIYSSINMSLADNIENLALQGGATVGRGNALANIITGSLNSDFLSGFSGNDTLVGGKGADRMTGGTGDDIFYLDNSGDVVIEGSNGGKDTIYTSVSYTASANVEWISLLSGASYAKGNNLANLITGNSLKNSLAGLGGNDQIRGLDGNDVITGGAGDDLLVGGVGTDTLYGNVGADTFLFRNTSDTDIRSSRADLIRDFTQSNHDRISLVQIDADTTKAGNQTFDFIESDAFSAAGQVRYARGDNETRVYLNTDADSGFEALIRLTGNKSLTGADFVL